MKIKIKNARLSYPHLFTPVGFDDDGEDARKRYGANLLVPIGSADDKNIQKIIKQLGVDKLGKKAEAQLKAWAGNSNKYCYTEGEAKDPEQYEGLMILSANRGEGQGAPVVVDRDPNIRLTAKDGKPYSGCYVNATVDLWIQTGKYSGLRCTLIAVQFSKDGEAFAGAPATVDDDDFDDLSDQGDDEEFEEEEEFVPKRKAAPASKKAKRPEPEEEEEEEEEEEDDDFEAMSPPPKKRSK